MRKTIWIARDNTGPGSYYCLRVSKPPERSSKYDEEWVGDMELCPVLVEKFLAPADRLKPGEGPKRIRITLGGCSLMTWHNHDQLGVNFALYYAACAGAGLFLLGMVAALLGG